MEFSAADVRNLREATGAGMMDCKKALVETNGDIEAAKDYLRKTGIQKAAKKADRGTGEGLVKATISADGKAGCLIALECETDFAARNEQFVALVDELGTHGLKNLPQNADQMLAQNLESGETVEGRIKSLVGLVGENMRLSRAASYENSAGRVGSYIHHDQKQGVLLSVTTSADGAATDEFLKKVGMHIASMRPSALSKDEIPAETIERERNIYLDDENLKKKPEEIQEKIISGKMDSSSLRTRCSVSRLSSMTPRPSRKRPSTRSAPARRSRALCCSESAIRDISVRGFAH